jgi:hypothetical protein
MRTQESNAATLEFVYRPVLLAISRAIRRLRDQAVQSNYTEELAPQLETLPLTSDDFALANARLRNAERYLRGSEAGAALWELKTLQSQLRAVSRMKTHEPRRRRRI